MFFLIFIIFITQLIITAIIVSALLSFDIRLLLVNDSVDVLNEWLVSRKSSIENIFSDIKLIIKSKEERLKAHRKKMLIQECIEVLEWVLLIMVKPRARKFVAGYKFAKHLYKKLSLFKNMI